MLGGVESGMGELKKQGLGRERDLNKEVPPRGSLAGKPRDMQRTSEGGRC